MTVEVEDVWYQLAALREAVRQLLRGCSEAATLVVLLSAEEKRIQRAQGEKR